MPENTPSGRVLLLDGHLPDAGERFARTGRLVAQLTQNMNFVLDMGARDFVAAHAESRMAADPLAHQTQPPPGKARQHREKTRGVLADGAAKPSGGWPAHCVG